MEEIFISNQFSNLEAPLSICHIMPVDKKKKQKHWEIGCE